MRHDLLGNKKQPTHESPVTELLKHTKTSMSAFGLFLTSHKNIFYVK